MAKKETALTQKKQPILYKWEGKDRKGSRQKGEISAVNEQLVRSYLQKQGIIPTRIAPKPKDLFETKGRVKTKDIVSFTRQMSTMLKAGMPVTSSLGFIADSVKKPLAYKEMLMELKDKVENGSSFSEALKTYPVLFDDLYTNLVAAGEEAGVLEGSMDKIAVNMEKAEATKKKIKKAIQYPIIVLIAAAIVTAILLIKVIPVFEGFFQGFGAELPALTQTVVNISHALRKYGVFIFIIIVISIFTFIFIKKRNKNFQRKVNKFTFKLPLFGGILNTGATARYARTMSVLFDAGVPLVSALKATAPATGAVIFEEAVNNVITDVENGAQLNFAMLQTGRFTAFPVQMVAIGEESGNLGEMLGNVATFYEEELDYKIDTLTSAIEPMIMAFLAIVVGGLVLAMYLPIFGLADVVG